ncbi:PadR family transcriptional regulator [bacterium]|nr:PadR family transcriptional regulator [bacterium]
MDKSIGLSNWNTQIKKGYLELCLLFLIKKRKRAYGFELLELLKVHGLSIKEGTLYPLLSRLSKEGVLSAQWEIAPDKGNPKKFYSVTDEGQNKAVQMKEEFLKMNQLLKELSNNRSIKYYEQ